jgi:hypothetical protein
LVFESGTEQTLFNLCDRILHIPDAPPASEEMNGPSICPPSWGHFLLQVAPSQLRSAPHQRHRNVSGFRHRWPANIGSRILCAVVARRTALPCFRRRISFRGLCRLRASPKALGLSSPRMVATSTALPATARSNPSKAASVGGWCLFPWPPPGRYSYLTTRVLIRFGEGPNWFLRELVADPKASAAG